MTKNNTNHTPENIYQDLVELAADGILLGDNNGNILHANSAIYEMFQLEPKDIINKHISELPWDKQSIEKAPFRFDLLNQGEKVKSVRIINRPNSTPLTIEMSSKIMPNGYYQSIVRDISNFIENEKIILLRKSYLRSIIENQPGLLWLKDENGHFLSVNQAFADACGFKDPEEIIGKTDLDVWPKDLAQIYINDDLNIMRTGQPMLIEEQVNENGQLKSLETFKKPIFNENNVAIGTTGYSRDVTERKKAENVLSYEKRLFESVVQDLPVMLFLKEAKELRFALMNHAGEELLGFKKEDLLGKNDYDFFPKEQADFFIKKDRETLQNKENLIISEEPIQTKDKGIRLLETLKIPILDKAGNPEFLLGFSTDITERKKAEEALLLKNQVFDKSIAANSIADADGKIIEANDSFLKLWGYQNKNEVIGSKISCFLSNQNETNAIISSLNNSNKWEGEYEAKRKDGSTFIAFSVATTLKDKNGNITGYQSSVIDITKNKIDENALRLSEEKYRLLFKNMIAGFAFHEMIYDKTGKPIDYKFLEINPAFENMTGLKSQDIIGRTVKEIIPDTEYFWIERYGKVAKTREPIFFQNYFPPLDKYFDIWAYSPSEDKFAVVFLDVTENKKAELEKARLQEQLIQAQKMESIGCLAGGIAHDFNNMLSVILGQTELALSKTESPNQINERLTEIQKAAEHSAELTKQLLAFARKQPITPEILDINETITEMISLLKSLVGENITLKWIPGKNIGNIKVDPCQLDQILTNITINAKDAIENTGQITISTNLVHFNENHCKIHNENIHGDFILLKIEDTGKGIEESTISKIFEPFFTTKESGKGTGLGLATVYGIIKQNHGFIDVFSAPKKGTNFNIYLPKTLENKLTKTIQPKIDVNINNKPPKSTVLLVEDELMVREMTTAMLELLGYTVINASTPKEAIVLANNDKNNINLLITDMIMPEMNGKDLSELILSTHPSLKCLYMSGYTADVIAKHGVVDDNICFIEKPFTIDALKSKLQQIFCK